MDEENNGFEEEISNIIILNDENGNEVKFEFLDLIEYESEDYVVLLPVLEDGEEDDGEVVILKVDDSDADSDEESSKKNLKKTLISQMVNNFKGNLAVRHLKY